MHKSAGPIGTVDWRVCHAGKSFFFQISCKHRIQFLAQKIARKVEKIPRKFMKLYWTIWNNFCYGNFVKFSTNVERKFGFLPRFEFKGAGDLSDLCSLMQIHWCTNLYKECSKMIYKYCSMIWMICIDQQPRLLKLSDFKNSKRTNG
jgi:hypothetical protein